MAKNKCENEFGFGITPLIKIFLRAFVSQKGIGFFVGDEDLRKIFTRWMDKKLMEKSYRGRLPGPRLKDIYNL